MRLLVDNSADPGIFNNMILSGGNTLTDGFVDFLKLNVIDFAKTNVNPKQITQRA